MVRPAVQRILSCLQNPTRLRILLTLRNELQPVGFNELSRRIYDVADVGLVSGKIAYHIGELMRAGLVEKVVDGDRPVGYVLTPLGRETLFLLEKFESLVVRMSAKIKKAEKTENFVV